MADDTLARIDAAIGAHWRAQVAARPGMAVYPPDASVVRPSRGLDDDGARRRILDRSGLSRLDMPWPMSAGAQIVTAALDLVAADLDREAWRLREQSARRDAVAFKARLMFGADLAHLPITAPRVRTEVRRLRLSERLWPAWRWRVRWQWTVQFPGRTDSGWTWSKRAAYRAAYHVEREWRARQPKPLFPINPC